MARQIVKEPEQSIDWLCNKVGIEYEGNTTGTQQIMGLVFRICIEQQKQIIDLKLQLAGLDWEKG